MKTLIELFDERASENVIGVETFKPETVIYICDSDVAVDKARQNKVREYFQYRGLAVTVEFVEVGKYESDKMYEQLISIAEKYPECALDVTGGSDAALVAAGMFAKTTNIPVFTYSRKQNTFYNISNADFAADKKCELEYSVSDFFKMAGGQLRKGRVDNNVLGQYMDKYEAFYKVFDNDRRGWARDINFMQRISQLGFEEPIRLDVNGSYYQKGERGGQIYANERFLHNLEELGFIKNLRIVKEESVAFDFADETVRNWLRDVGSFLELFIYKKCVDAGIFNDVISSAIVEWDGTNDRDSVSNEIDAMATRGIVPLFISCKATQIKTEALNELAILRDRFGGKGAKAAIVTTEYCNAATRHRAAQLGITVIDREELEAGGVVDRLKTIMKVK